MVSSPGPLSAAAHSFIALGLLSAGLFGCQAGIKTAVGPKGSHIITCGNGMKTCVVKADSICGDEGYEILEGVSRPRVLGGSSSAYKTRTEVAEMTIVCGLPGEEENAKKKASYELPARSDEPLPPEEPIGSSVSGSDNDPQNGAACTPGATQTCVGPGACQGGQVCLESGSGYGPCDCGDAAPKKAASERAGAREDSSEGPSTSQPGEEPKVPVPGAAPTPTPLGHQK